MSFVFFNCFNVIFLLFFLLMLGKIMENELFLIWFMWWWNFLIIWEFLLCVILNNGSLWFLDCGFYFILGGIFILLMFCLSNFCSCVDLWSKVLYVFLLIFGMLGLVWCFWRNKIKFWMFDNFIVFIWLYIKKSGVWLELFWLLIFYFFVSKYL